MVSPHFIAKRLDIKEKFDLQTIHVMGILFSKMRSSRENPYRKQIENIKRIELNASHSFTHRHRRNGICIDTNDNPSSPLSREEMIRELDAEIKNEIHHNKNMDEISVQ